MAKKQTSIVFRELVGNIRAGKLAPIYFLQGEETYYLDRLADLLSDSVIPEDDRDFNFITFYGADSAIEDVIAQAQRYPMMSDRQLVILKEAQSLQRAKQQLEKLLGYAEHPSLTTVLVIVYKGEAIASTSKLLKAILKNDGVVFTSPLLREYELEGPIKDYCIQKKISIDDKSTELLIEFIGCNLSKIFGEIDKLIVAENQKNLHITPDLIEKNIGISKDFNNFELTKAFAAKDYVKAMRVINYFARNPGKNPTPATTGTLFSFFSRLVIAHFSKDKSDSALMAALNLRNTYALKEIRQAMRSFNASQSVNAISLLRKFDRESKGVGSMQNEFELQKELIFNLFTTS